MPMSVTILSTKARPLKKLEIAAQAQPPMPPDRPWKLLLLLFLAGCLGALLIMHILAVAIQSTFPPPVTCAGTMRTADYTREINLQPEYQQMNAIQIADTLDGGEPAALVQVTNDKPANTLDVYVFGCAMQQNHPRLTRLFTRQGLVQGTAEITATNTLRLASLDTRLDNTSIALLQPSQQNIYQEYTWQQGHFVQLPFSGFYPVSSQFEAESLQQNANIEHHSFWADPVATAVSMSRDLLHWTSNPQTRLLSETPVATLVEISFQHPRVVLEVMLKRLIQPDKAGLWFVTSAHTRGLVLTRAGTTNQPFQTSVSSPIHFSGVSALIDGQTTATLFDHTLTPIAGSSNVPVTVQQDSSYSGTLTYHSPGGGQQGVILLQSLPLPQNYKQETEQVLLTSVILN